MTSGRKSHGKKHGKGKNGGLKNKLLESKVSYETAATTDPTALSAVEETKEEPQSDGTSYSSEDESNNNSDSQ